MTTTCNICNQPASDGYVNERAGERCVDPCHEQYASTLTLTEDDVQYVYEAAMQYIERSGSHRLTDADHRRFASWCAGYARQMDTLDIHFPSMLNTWA